MDRLKYIKLENEDGSYSSSIPLAVDSDHVDVNGNPLTDELNNKANNSSIVNLQNQINSLASGSPKGVYTDAEALKAANPDTGVYIVTENGHIYSWTKDSTGNPIDLGVYQATRVDENDPIIAEIKNSLNDLSITELIDVTATIMSGYYSETGILKTGQYHIEIPVSNGETYKIKSYSGWDLRAYVLMNNDTAVFAYQKEDNPVYHGINNALYVTIPSGVNKLIINSLDNNYIGAFKGKVNLKESCIPNEFVKNWMIEDGCITLDKLVDKLSNLFAETYEGQDISLSTGFMESNGSLNQYADAQYCSLNVSKNEKFKITSNYGYSMRQYVLLDINGNVVSVYPSTNTSSAKTETNTFTISSDGTLYINTYTNVKLVKLVGYKFADKTLNPLFNKKAIFFGDSITAGNGSWADITTIRNNNNMSGENYGVGGSTYTVKSNADNSNCIYNRIKYVRNLGTMDDADYIILQGGVNDAFQNLSIGTMLSETDFTTECDTSKFAGAFEMAIRFVLTNWLGKKVGFIANAKIPRNTNMKAYMDMAKDICKKYSVPVLDLWDESGLCAGIDEVNENYYKVDDADIGHGGTHPTLEGYEKYINNKVEAWMRNL